MKTLVYLNLQKVNTIMKKDIISELDHSNIQEDISWFGITTIFRRISNLYF